MCCCCIDAQLLEVSIVGMLRNFGLLPIDRILNMAKMFVEGAGVWCVCVVCVCEPHFVAAGPSLLCSPPRLLCSMTHTADLTLQQLQRQLGRMVQEEKLECDGAHYKLSDKAQ